MPATWQDEPANALGLPPGMVGQRSVASAAALARAHHGKLDLGEPVRRHLSELAANCELGLRLNDLIGPIPLAAGIW